MSKEEEERAKAIAKAAVKELMDQVYRGIGRGVIERVFWIAIGVAINAYLGWHFPGVK
jgi:hypothetical protein